MQSKPRNPYLTILTSDHVPRMYANEKSGKPRTPIHPRRVRFPQRHHLLQSQNSRYSNPTYVYLAHLLPPTIPSPPSPAIPSGLITIKHQLYRKSNIEIHPFPQTGIQPAQLL
ncbi:hypothetical protein DSO57_1014559 [Entomophthora muscae]|uniref:Uncharacterized protein n=1 Tax=Entomophthora muscae TaxID=34485 RepID=A0ACC2SUH5_9FUNG|nr:hypothetical protein DSO57_1014559 [Entomophthora muscae]